MKEQAAMWSRWSAGVRNTLACLWPAGMAGEQHPGFFEGRKQGFSREPHSDFWTNFSRRSEESTRGRNGSNIGEETPLSILVPIDFTPSSFIALACAFGMARRKNAHLTLLHAVYINLTPYGPANLGLIEQQMRETALTTISKIMATAKRANVPIRYVIQKGKPCAAIEDYIRQNDVDLVILAPHKHHGLARFLSRKTAETVIRHTNCPVLIVNH